MVGEDLERIKELSKQDSPFAWNKARLWEGTHPKDEGAWLTTAYRVRCGVGMISASTWSPLGRLDAVPPVEMERIAEQNRLPAYVRVRSSQECVQYLSQGLSIQAGLEITSQWIEAGSGSIKEIPDHVTPRESHTVQIFHCDMENRRFGFENSWGANWGRQGLGILSFDYFDKWNIDTWVPVFASNELFSTSDLDESCMTTRLLLNPPHVLVWTTFYELITGKKMGWFMARSGVDSLDVEDFHVRREFRNRGHGNRLCEELRIASDHANLPLRLLVPYADSCDGNHSNIRWIAGKLGLGIAKSRHTWAGYEATPSRLPSIRIPARPRAALNIFRYEQIGSEMIDQEEKDLKSRTLRNRRRAVAEDG